MVPCIGNINVSSGIHSDAGGAGEFSIYSRSQVAVVAGNPIPCDCADDARAGGDKPNQAVPGIRYVQVARGIYGNTGGIIQSGLRRQESVAKTIRSTAVASARDHRDDPGRDVYFAD